VIVFKYKGDAVDSSQHCGRNRFHVTLRILSPENLNQIEFIENCLKTFADTFDCVAVVEADYLKLAMSCASSQSWKQRPVRCCLGKLAANLELQT